MIHYRRTGICDSLARRHAAVRQVMPGSFVNFCFSDHMLQCATKRTSPNPSSVQTNKIEIPIRANLAHDHALKTGHIALLGGDFEVSVNDSYGKENTSTATESAEKVAANRQSSNAGTTEGGRSGDDALKLLVHGLLTVTSHNQTLLLELLSNITGR